MSLRWLKFTLRIIAIILVVVAAVRFAHTVSFHSEEQPTSRGVTIDHVFAVGQVAIIIPLIALLLFALSFVVPSKRVE
jgi:hypothetical protein